MPTVAHRWWFLQRSFFVTPHLSEERYSVKQNALFNDTLTYIEKNTRFLDYAQFENSTDEVQVALSLQKNIYELNYFC